MTLPVVRPIVGRLDYITVEGFKSIHKRLRVDLRNLNVLIGANGVGKSNLVDVFGFLHVIREGRMREFVSRAGGADSLLSYGSTVTPKMRFELSFNESTNLYMVELAATEQDSLAVSNEEAQFWNKSEYPSPYTAVLNSADGPEASISAEQTAPVAIRVQGHLRSWRVYHYQDSGVTSPMKKYSHLEDCHHLREDGANLASFLHMLRDKYRPTFDLIESTVQQIAPFFASFQLDPSRHREDQIILSWNHKQVDRYFPASALSDGTLRFIALATLLLQPDELKPSVIVVDEPELGLHPYAITVLASLMRQAATRRQVLVATQSSILLDEMDPEDILVTSFEGGTTTVERLNEHALTEWLHDYSLGQLWEKNMFGGRPSPG